MSLGGGSYFKGWASNLPYIPNQIGSNASQEVWLGHVLDIDYNELGKIRVRLVGTSKELLDSEVMIEAYPADLNIIKYPLPGELVIIAQGLRNEVAKNKFAIVYYYIATLSSSQNITFNSDPYIGQTVPERHVNRIYTPEYEHRFEDKLNSKETYIDIGGKLKSKAALQPYEGDFILQGRFGASIRLGSTDSNKSNEWSKVGSSPAGSPIMILAAKLTEGSDTVSEEVDAQKASSVYLCSSQTVPVTMAAASALRSHLVKYDIKATDGDLVQTADDVTKALESEANTAAEADRDNYNADLGIVDPNRPAGANGNLPPDKLKRTSIGIKLEAEAADAWDRLVAAARADGVPDIGATDGYRSYETQQRIFDWDLYVATGGSRTDVKPNKNAKRKKVGSNGTVAVAFPGTSNHGWGRAVDASGKKFKKWLKINGWKYGWSWYEGKSVGEDWHFTYTTDTALLKSYVNYTNWA